MEAWEGFKGVKWQRDVDVANFIEMNYQEYKEDGSFLKGCSKKTTKLLKKIEALEKKERISGVLNVDVNITSGIDNFNPGYIDYKSEVIVGLQTDEPLKRIINPYSGIEKVKHSLESYGFTLDRSLEDSFKEFCKTQNVGIEQVYNDEINKCIDNYLITGLPDSYDRGSIIGDYRRLALYGTSFLIEKKENDIKKLSTNINSTTIRLMEEVEEQIHALKLIEKMASRYDLDVSVPATNAKEAIQWIYIAYLATIKQNNGVASSIGRNSAFIDIYIERDLKNGLITEEEAQELIDQFILKLRIVRHLRSPEYVSLFKGEPTLVTESIGGMLNEDKSFVTKTSYRMLNSLNNLGNFKEPNLTVLWSNKLPSNFKTYVTSLIIKTHNIQCVNDDITRVIFGTDYAISGGVSALMEGRQIKLYGSRINLPKILLYALNGGRDEITNELVIGDIEQIEGEYLDFDEVLKLFEKVLKKVCKIYVDALNIIHYMQDKYSYESAPMAFHDTLISRIMSFGIAGLSTVVDSLSAIKYGRVRVKRNKNGLTENFDIDTDFPIYGNNDDRADEIAKKLTTKIYQCLKKNSLYRNSEHTLSINSMTFNDVYGFNTGETPDKRKARMPFSLGANPSNGRDKSGALAALQSISKIPYKACLDGISNTFFIDPNALGSKEASVNNLVHILDGYFKQGAQHISLNCISKEELKDAMVNPSKYQNLIIGISGYFVHFTNLDKKFQEEILTNTFHEAL